jgi:hypothetical protein
MDDDLLEFGTIEVFYIVWERPDAAYYLKDMTNDLGHVEWTKNKTTALYFFTEKEAGKHVKYFSKTRHGIYFEVGDRDLLDDLDMDDLP